jgi:peptidoglycan hydrolase-like protein with peptidoglycan-binding domain
MWRSFALGMTAGADVRELETDLVALGFDPGHDITIDGDFTWATAAAVERWQHARGLAETGSIPLGQILFVRSPVRVGTVAVSAGMAALPGSTVFSGTTLTPSVVVDLDPHAQLHVSTGQAVVVTLPDSTDTTGHITQVQPATSGSSTTGTPAGGAGTVQSQAAIPVIISLDHPRQAGAADASPVQVQFTTAEHHHVLTVPTTALLAEPGGHYAVQVAGQTGARLVRVTAGLFDDTTGMAEVASLQLRPGMRVEVPAS